jgi:hypothetical protein
MLAFLIGFAAIAISIIAIWNAINKHNLCQDLTNWHNFRYNMRVYNFVKDKDEEIKLCVKGSYPPKDFNEYYFFPHREADREKYFFILIGVISFIIGVISFIIGVL